MSEINLSLYKDFVQEVTSNESNQFDAFIDRLHDLNKTDVNIPLLITSALGLCAESGEYTEIIKKVVFQKKPLSEENIEHMFIELGDIMWYWINACRSMNFDPNEVIARNIKKLEARYPGGKFDAYYSENRKEGDL